ELKTNGALWAYYQGGWALLDRGVNQFELNGASILALETTGKLVQFTGSGDRTLLDTNVADFGVAGDGTVYELRNNGDLVRGNGAGATTLASNVIDFAVSPDGSVIALDNAGKLVRFIGSDQQTLDADTVSAFRLAPDGTLYERKNSATLRRLVSGAFTNVDTG